MSQPQDNYSNFTPGPAPGGPGMPPQMGRGGPPPPGFRPGMPSPPFPASPGPMMPPPGQRQTPPPGIPPMMNQQQPLFRQGPPPQMSQQQWQPQPTQPFMGSPQAQAQGQPPHRVSPLPDQRASPQPQTITQQNQPQSQHMPPPTHQIPPQRMMPPPGPPQGQQTPGGMPPPMRQPPVPGQPGAIPPPGAPAQTPPTPAQPFSRYPPPGPAGFGQQPPMASPPNIPPPMSQPGQVPPPAHTMRPDGLPAQPPPPPLSSQQRQGVPPPASSGYPYPPIHNLSLNDNLQQSLPPHIPPPSVPAPQALAFGDAAGQGGFQAPSIMGGQQRPMIPAPVSQQPQDMKMQQPQAPAQHQHQQQQPQSAANRIDVRQIPTPVKMKKYPDMYKKVIYRTVTQGLIPPPANSRYKVVDEGSCDPRFIRATLHCAPKSDDILKNSNLVFGAILQPLAEITPDSSSYGTENEVVGGGKQVVSYAGRRNPIPVVNFGEEEPIRCNRCKAYINPFVTFIDAGVKYICNFCGFTNEVPHDYVCNLDGYGRRRDIDRRPELKFGSVEIVATQKYYTNNTLPAPLTYVFLIDVSQNAINQGILTTFISSLKPILNDLAAINPKSKVAFITYARNIHFYSVKKDGSAPNMLVVGDVDNVFVPIPESALLSFSDVDAIDGFLSKLEGLVAGLQEVDCCLGSALSAAYQLLSETGGKVLAFCSNLPNRGKGAIKTREDMKLYGTPKEKVLFSPQEGFWKVFADECAKAQISVDTFLFPSTFNEAATLGHISKKTCGQLYLYNSFNVNRDAERFQFELQRNLRRETGYNGILRVRCSRGFTIKRYYGHYYESNEGDMDLAGIDCDKSFGVEFKFDGKFEDEFAYIQSALLYTTSDGHRLIRIHTLKMDVGNTVGKVFRGADVDAYMAMQSRWAIDKVIHGGSNDTIAAVRDQLTEKCIDLLTSYKKHCATAPSPGQLILPESLKFTPVYILALSKTTALRQGTDIPLDERISAMYALMTLPVDQVLAFIYPRLYALHNMPPPLLNDDGTIDCSLPPPLNPSSENIQHDGVYLLDDTVHTFFWVGREADPEIVQQLFNVPSVDELSPLFARLQPADTDLGRRVSAILQELRQYRSTYGRLRVFRERDPGESQFFARLVEDKSQSAMSYVEYLCHLHREIQLKLS